MTYKRSDFSGCPRRLQFRHPQFGSRRLQFGRPRHPQTDSVADGATFYGAFVVMIHAQCWDPLGENCASCVSCVYAGHDVECLFRDHQSGRAFWTGDSW